MASYIANDSDLTLVADAIRSKGKTTNSLVFPNEFVNAIAAISTGGTYNLQSKTITPFTATQTVLPDTNYDALSSVTVESIPSAYIIPTGTKSITTNGTGINVAQYAAVDVTVPTSGNDFVVILSYNDQTEMWEPDKTFTEIMTAYSEGKHIIIDAAGTSDNVIADGEWNTSSNDFTYVVHQYNDDGSGGNGFIENFYTMSSSGIDNPSMYSYVSPSGTLSITENGTTDVTNYASVNVNVSGGGGGGSANMSDPIRFFDYDGTLVASYSAVPESLPSVPTHSKLTNGTWNYTLAQMATQFNAVGTCDVGANYDTVSGATEIDIVLQRNRLHPYLSLAINGTVTIDWGDNSTDTATGTSLTTRLSTIHHEYTAAGSYTIKITKTSGTGYSLYCTTTYSLLHKNSSTSIANRIYSNCVQAVRIGEDCDIGNYAFYGCYSLTSVSIPSGITSISSSAFSSCHSLIFVSIPSGVTNVIGSMFYNCYSLVSISIPSGVTSIGSSAFCNCSSLASISIPSGVTSIDTSAFSSCYSLASILIPSGVTRIGNSAFYNCSSFTSISIPSGVTSIGSSAFYACYSLAFISIPSGVTSISTQTFYNCYGMAEYHFESITPPTLANINAFTNIQSDCVIYVPAESLTAYKEAENWSTYASYMVGE